MVSGCGSKTQSAVAEVNGVPISAVQWDSALRGNALMNGERPNMTPALEKVQLSTYADQVAVMQYSQKQHWLTPQKASAEAGAAIAQAVRAHFGNRTSLFALLHRYQVGPKNLVGYVAGQMWLIAAFDHVTQPVPQPSLQDIQTYYQHHPQQFVTPTAVLAREIVMPTAAEAASVMSRWAHGARFTALAQKYSSDRSNRDSGGTMGWVLASLNPLTPTNAFLLGHSAGHSGIVHTRLGYAIIEVQAVQGGTPLPLSEAAQGVKEQLWRAARAQAFDQWSRTIIRRADVKLL